LRYINSNSEEKTEEKLQALKGSNEKVVNSIGESILVIDPNNYRIISANEQAPKALKNE
jgi:hypothetical protein